jgi:hypothetical protein
MATLKEERARLQFLEEHGRGDEKVHVVFIEQEAAERVANEAKGIQKPKTRFQMETDDPEMYSAFNAEKDRYIRCAVNKSVALSLMLRCWQQLSDEMIRTLAADEPAEKEPSA